ncbi:hypothetical protein PVAP13_5NG362481 [Panicum virgatum]|uniref:Reverse transcriptase zinc-binding domain-containing protein n=1 Tax=Panicum virgatum TaxID=38727 RepID=A0A8T0RSS1_PANVG|nr:hypothetical protein PVAP13_5NG362481 [Panicum virgatum]
MSAIPVYTAVAISISPWVLKCIDKRRRAFLWKGTDSVSGGHCVLGWPKVCRPPDLGGLGIPDLQIQGYALRMRWLWAKRTDPNRPWSALHDRAESIVLDMFNASISIQIGNGQRSYFWTDRWIQGRSIKDLAPALLAAVHPRAQRQRTVAEGLSNRAWVRDITGALTVQHPIPGAKLLRKTKAPGHCKFFVWLVLHDRCWTAARRKRYNLQDDDSCGACFQLSETISHILVGCVYAREVWSNLLRRWNWLRLAAGLSTHLEFTDWRSWSRKQVHGDDRKAFDTLLVLVVWLLWKERNNSIFQNSNMLASDLVLRIIEEGKAWAYAGFRHLQKFFPDALSLRSQNLLHVIA